MMKRNILAVIVPALLVAGTANAAEIYNKDGNKVDLYGKAVGLHYFSKGNGENSYGGNGDMTYARLGFKGETQINSDLTGYGQWEYNFQGNNSEGADAQTGNKTRLAFAGLIYKHQRLRQQNARRSVSCAIPVRFRSASVHRLHQI